MTKYRPLARMAMVFAFIFLVFLAIEPFTGFGQTAPPNPNIIGNRIFCDNNLDGQLSSGEFIPNVAVTVENWSSDFVTTTVTDAGGNYLFTGLPVDPSVSNTVTDAYTVTVDIATLPVACNVPAVDPDGVLDNMSIVVFDANRTDNRSQKFGYQPPAGVVSAGTSQIGNFIFCDADLSGDATNAVNQQPEGLPNVGVTLAYAKGGTLSTTTDAKGGYTFENVASGQYTVTVDTADLPSACTIPFIDGDSDNSMTTTTNLDNMSTLFVQVDETNSLQDFGYQSTEQLASIGDRVWCDDNANTVYDGSAEGMGGISLTITESVATNPAVYTTVTDPIGRYFFYNLASGTYTVTVDASTLPATCSTPLDDFDGGNDDMAAVTVVSAQKNESVDFGYSGFLEISDIGGQLWCETTLNGQYDIGEVPFGGVPVTLTNSLGISSTIPTDVSGMYLFANLSPDTYTIGVDASVLPATCNAPSLDPDGTFDNQTAVILVAAVDQLDINFAYEAPPMPTPVPTNTPAPTDTPTPLPTDTPTPLPTNTPVPGASATPTTMPTNTSVPTNTPMNTPIPASTTTTMPTTAATTMPTTMPTTAATTMPTTMATAMPTTAATTMPTTMPTTMATVMPATGSIGGSVWCDNDANNTIDAGEAMANVEVSLIGTNSPLVTAMTNTDGAYLFDSLVADTYTLIVSANTVSDMCNSSVPNSVNNPDGTVVELSAGANMLDVDYMYMTTATMADVIFVDANANGTQDAGEEGLAGVMIELFNSAGEVAYSATTAADGAYSIANIMPGQYRIKVTLPAGWEIESQGASNLGATIDPTTGQTTLFDIVPGSTNLSFTLGTAAAEGGAASSAEIYLPVVERQ